MQLNFKLFKTRALAPRVLAAALSAGVFGILPAATQAQSLFAPAIQVNEHAVTYYELDQRILFQKVLRLPGVPDRTARKDLVDERLKQAVLKEAGVELTPESLEQAMTAFASRANLSLEEFVKAIGQEGIAFETFRDYVAVNLAWRDFISAQFLGQARPTPEEIDRALAQEGNGGLRVLLSEIIIPVTPQNQKLAEEEADRIAQVRSFEAFSEAAAQFSATESRTNGGRLDWMPISNLPPALRPVILALDPGDVTSPLPIPNALALFQMRGIAEGPVATPRYSEIEYAVLYLAGGRSPETQAHAAQLKATMDTCNDLYGVAKGLPAGALFRDSVAPSSIPRDVAIELAKLDRHEVSASLVTRDNRLMFIMLCNRTGTTSDEGAREQMAVQLTQQRLQALSDSLVAQLRANAHIVER